MKKQRLLLANKALPYALLTTLFLTIPFFLRWLHGDPLVPFLESYVALHGTGWYAFLLAKVGTGAFTVSVGAGVVTALLLQRVTRVVRAPYARAFILLASVANPLFLTLFTSLDVLTLAVPLALASIAYKESHFQPLLLVASIVASPLFGLVTGALLFAHATTMPVRRKATLGLLAGSLLLFLVPVSSSGFSFQPAIMEFGVARGASFLLVLFALLEITFSWGERADRWRYLTVILLFLAAPFHHDVLVLASLASAWLAGRFYYRLSTRKWSLRAARPITLLLLACTLLFLGLHALAVTSSAEPTSELVSVLAPAGPGNVLTLPAYGPAIEALTDYHAIVHDCTIEANTCAIATKIYATRHERVATTYLNELDVDFLLVTSAMRNGEVWQRDEEGFLFLLAHSKKFVKVNAEDGYELWRYERGGPS